MPGQQYRITLTVDEDYLTDPNTVYPVTIDPTLTVSDNTHGAGAIEDAPIYEGYPTSNFGSYQYNRAGYAGTTYKRGRTVVRLTGMLNNSGYATATASQIASVNFYIADASGTSGANVKAYALISNTTWQENNVSWHSVGTCADNPVDTATPSGGNYAAFNITDLAKVWKSGSYSNGRCGFILVGANENSVDKSLYSSENTTTNKRPYVTATYTTSSYSIQLATTSFSLNEGASATIGKSTIPSGLEVTWSSNDTSVATVDSTGKVTAKKAGVATITASAVGAASQTCTVYVTIADGVYYIKNVASEYYLDAGGADISSTTNIRQYIKVESATNKLAQMWKIHHLGSGLYSVRPMHKQDMGLHISSGDVDIGSIGTTDTIAGVTNYARWYIASSNEGYVFQCQGATSDTLAPAGNSLLTNAQIVPTVYSSSNPSQCWMLDPVDAPPAGILIYDTNTGKTSSYYKRYIAPNETLTLADLELTAAVYSPATNSQSVAWSSSNPTAATVNSSTGAVTGINPGGSTTITASATLNGVTYSKSYTLYVTTYYSELYSRFDDGYAVFYGETRAQSADKIDAYTRIVERRYRELLGLNLVLNYPTYYASALDLCKGTVTAGNLHADCPHATAQVNPVDHVFVSSVQNDFEAHFSGHDALSNVFWSCHKIVTYKSGSNIKFNRSFATRTYVFMIDNSNPILRDERTLAILMHELNHLYGAHDHYHDPSDRDDDSTCTNRDICSECNPQGRPTSCIMYTKEVDINADTVLCTACKNDMLQHLNAHHCQ